MSNLGGQEELVDAALWVEALAAAGALALRLDARGDAGEAEHVPVGVGEGGVERERAAAKRGCQICSRLQYPQHASAPPTTPPHHTKARGAHPQVVDAIWPSWISSKQTGHEIPLATGCGGGGGGGAAAATTPLRRRPSLWGVRRRFAPACSATICTASSSSSLLSAARSMTSGAGLGAGGGGRGQGRWRGPALVLALAGAGAARTPITSTSESSAGAAAGCGAGGWGEGTAGCAAAAAAAGGGGADLGWGGLRVRALGRGAEALAAATAAAATADPAAAAPSPLDREVTSSSTTRGCCMPVRRAWSMPAVLGSASDMVAPPPPAAAFEAGRAVVVLGPACVASCVASLPCDASALWLQKKTWGGGGGGVLSVLAKPDRCKPRTAKPYAVVYDWPMLSH